MTSLDPIIMALDTSDPAQADRWLADWPDIRRVKVGLQLYLAAGFPYVESLVDRDYRVFLDLKFHDIPNTVAGAMGEACRRDVWLTTVHGLGGPRMVRAAADARDGLDARTLIVAVTVLTSHAADEWQSLGMAAGVTESARLLADRALAAGADGVVCSPSEVGELRSAHPDAELVTPGIRMAGQDAGDQRRVRTPAEALAAGSSWLVMGRSLTGAADPQQAAADLAAHLNPG